VDGTARQDTTWCEDGERRGLRVMVCRRAGGGKSGGTCVLGIVRHFVSRSRSIGIRYRSNGCARKPSARTGSISHRSLEVDLTSCQVNYQPLWLFALFSCALLPKHQCKGVNDEKRKTYVFPTSNSTFPSLRVSVERSAIGGFMMAIAGCLLSSVEFIVSWRRGVHG
jgi:hypothetical protein